MLIRYSSPLSEIEIIASREEFSDLASRLLRDDEVEITTGKGSIGYYEILLRSIVVKKVSVGNVRLKVIEGGVLSIEGESGKLCVLSRNLSEFAEAGQDDDHLHIEYFPDHFYLAPDSAPTVLAFE